MKPRSLRLGGARARSEDDMERERQKPSRHRGERRARRTARPRTEPLIFAARRPNAARGTVTDPQADETRRVSRETTAPEAATATPAESSPPPPARRSARIVESRGLTGDERMRERERLLARLLRSEGRSAITRAADEFRRAGFEFPAEQAVQLQLLEHLDEAQARTSIAELGQILLREPPQKRPVFEQRLRRLEDTAEEEITRRAAAELRKALRV